MSTTPEALFRRFLEDGDERALDGLFRRCGPPLRQFGASLGLEPGTVEDLVQESLVTAVQRAEAFDGTRPLLPWLKGILARKAARHVRDTARRSRRDSEAAEAAAPTPREPADSLAEAELRRAVTHALADLPDRYAVPLRLHLLEGLAPREVAEKIGIPRATVRVQLHRGLEMLRRMLPAGFALALTLQLRARDRSLWSMTRSSTPLRGVLFAGLLAGAVVLSLALGAFDRGATGEPRVRVEQQTVTASSGGAAEDLPRRSSESAVSRTEVVTARASVLVRVLEPGGDPLPDVGVWCESVGVDPLAHRDRRRTDALGEARFGAPDTAFLVRTDRGASVRVPAGYREPVELTVQAGRTVAGRVLTDLGTPVAGADLWLGRAGDGAWVGGAVATTGPDGTFELHHIQPGATLAARAPGHGRSAPVAVHSGYVDVVLRPLGGTVAGVVRDAWGLALPGLPVSLGRSLGHAVDQLADGAAVCPAPPVVVRTDENGRFGPVAMEAGKHPVFVRTAGFAPGAAHVTVSRGQREEVELTLQPSHVLQGVVVRPDRSPAAFVEVSYRTAHRHHVVDLLTADDGTFVVEAPHTDGVLAVRAEGCEPVMHRVAAGQRNVRLELAQPWRFEFMVETPDGNDHRLEVRVRYPAHTQLESGEEIVVTRGGLVAVPVPADRDLAFAARHRGDPIWHPVELLAGNPPKVVVGDELRPSAILTGRCLDAEGAPVSGGRVFVGHPDGVLWEAGRTVVSGGFRIGPLVPAAEYRLFVESTHGVQPSYFGRVTDVRADERREISLVAPRTGTVRFVLRDATGEPVHDAVVTVVAEGRRHALRKHGTGEVALQPGAYELYAMGERFSWIHGIPFHVKAGETTEVSRTIEPAVRTVLALSGLPAGSVDVEVRETGSSPEGGDSLGDYTLLAGSVPQVVAFLPVGSYEAVVRQAGADLVGTFAIGDLTPRFDPVPVHLIPRSR